MMNVGTRYNEETADKKYHEELMERRREIDEEPIHYVPDLEDDEDYSDELYED